MIGLGYVGTLVVGVGAGATLVDVPASTKEVPAIEATVETPIIQDVCKGEEFKIDKTPLCMDVANYGLVKSALKSKYQVNNYIEWQDYALHIGVLDNEIKKQGGITLEGLTRETNIVDVLTNELM